ncbi:unnamed protein product [Pseudo-nitzschia multistriata]|uniref:ShKT domain-containing protein n=1 Tax=Pseudo-nitzschia multistriata TaxID=183589 RepID=A0A448ZNN0_9STRA|nr:unnamed protein product [Pseudo-nitzschia multistriata]
MHSLPVVLPIDRVQWPPGTRQSSVMPRSDRVYAHRVVWPTDSFSSLSDISEAGKNVPFRKDALLERGNKPGTFFPEVDGDAANFVVDAIEALGMSAVLDFAARIATAGEAKQPSCDEGIRRGGSRSGLAGRFRNPCAVSWASSGIESCDSCSFKMVTSTTGHIPIVCAPRDLPSDGSCSCNHNDNPPEVEPTVSPVMAPTPKPATDPSCLDDPAFRFRDRKKFDCARAARKKKCKKKFRKRRVREWCPESCGFCPKVCSACESNKDNNFVVYTGRGYCSHQSDKKTK